MGLKLSQWQGSLVNDRQAGTWLQRGRRKSSKFEFYREPEKVTNTSKRFCKFLPSFLLYSLFIPFPATSTSSWEIQTARLSHSIELLQDNHFRCRALIRTVIPFFDIDCWQLSSLPSVSFPCPTTGQTDRGPGVLPPLAVVGASSQTSLYSCTPSAWLALYTVKPQALSDIFRPTWCSFPALPRKASIKKVINLFIPPWCVSALNPN